MRERSADINYTFRLMFQLQWSSTVIDKSPWVWELSWGFPWVWLLRFRENFRGFFHECGMSMAI